MDLVPSAADDDTHDTEQDEGYAADDEPMRKIELFYSGYGSTLVAFRLQPNFNEAADGLGPARKV